MKAFLLFLTLSFFFQHVASSGLIVQRDTSVTDNPSPTQLATAQAVFPTPGGTDANVATTVSSTTPMSTSTSVSSQPSATSSHRLAHPNIRAAIIIGSILGIIIISFIIALVIKAFNRRRKLEEVTSRWSFHRDLMIRRRQTQPSTAPMSSDISPSESIVPCSQDLEQGIPDPTPVILPMHKSNQDPEVGSPSPIRHPPLVVVGPRGRGPKPTPLRKLDLNPHRTLPPLPISPRSPAIVSSRAVISPGLIRSPMPRSPSPRTHRQRAISDQIELLRIQMLQFERTGGKKDNGDGGAVMDEMSKKMAWLRDQQEGSWALGLTEVTPLGYDRYMT